MSFPRKRESSSFLINMGTEMFFPSQYYLPYLRCHEQFHDTIILKYLRYQVRISKKFDKRGGVPHFKRMNDLNMNYLREKKKKLSCSILSTTSNFISRHFFRYMRNNRIKYSFSMPIQRDIRHMAYSQLLSVILKSPSKDKYYEKILHFLWR